MELVIRCNESLMETNNFATDFLRLLIHETLDSNVIALWGRGNIASRQQVVDVVAMNHVNTAPQVDAAVTLKVLCCH